MPDPFAPFLFWLARKFLSDLYGPLRPDPVLRAMSRVRAMAIKRTAGDLVPDRKRRRRLRRLLRNRWRGHDVRPDLLATDGGAGKAINTAVTRWVTGADVPRRRSPTEPTVLAGLGLDRGKVITILEGHVRDAIRGHAGPGTPLQAVHDRLVQDSLLAEIVSMRTELVTRPPGIPVADLAYALPPRQALYGRGADTRALTGLIETHRADEVDRPLVLVVHGMGGVGKTSLAATLAWALSRNEGRDVPFIDFDGWTPDARGEQVPPADPADVLRDLLTAHGIRVDEFSPGRHPGLWRDVASRRAIPAMVFDNVRSDTDLRDLIPIHPCVVLVTSRKKFTGLPGATEYHLKVLDPDVTRAALADTRVDPDPEALEELVKLTGGLPLAIEAVRGVLRRDDEMPMGDLTGEIAAGLHNGYVSADVESPLAASTRHVEAAFELSYRHLHTDLERRAVCLLALQPGTDLTVFGLARLADIPEPRAWTILSTLKTAHMIGQQSPRWKFHNLFAVYAGRKAAADLPAEEWTTALPRLVSGYADMAKASEIELSNDHDTDTAMGGSVLRAWLTAERDNLTALVEALADEQRLHVLAELIVLTLRAGFRLYHLGLHEHAETCFRYTLIFAERVGDGASQANAIRGLARIAMIRGEHDTAVELFTTARAADRSLGNRDGEAHATWGLGEIARQHAEYRRAEKLFGKALEMNRTLRNRSGEAGATRGLGRVALARGDYRRAEAHFTAARDAYRAIDDAVGDANSTRGLGHVALARGRFEEARELFTTARTRYEQIGHRTGEAHACRGLGHVLWAQGEFTAAEESYRRALGTYRDTGDRTGEADAARGLGQAALSRGDLDEATTLFETARQAHHDLADRMGEADAVRGLGQVMLVLEKWTQAEEYFEFSRRLHQDIGNLAGVADALYQLGFVAKGQVDPASARSWWEQALGIYVEIDSWFTERTREALRRLGSDGS